MAELFIITLFAEKIPWVWMLSVTLPLLGWFIAEHGYDFRSAIIALLDMAAEQHELVKNPSSR